MDYFKNCQSIEEIKKCYRELAKQYHPDANKTIDTHETMKQINLQYEQQKGRKFTNVNHETKETYEQTFDPFDGFREIIDQLINLSDITIELCGTWLWITGETKQHKETLKELGFNFSGKKLAWYWKPGTYRKKSKKELTIDEIRNLYGSQKYNSNDNDKEDKKAIA